MWHCFEQPDRVRELSALVDRMAEEAGRDRASIGRAGSLSISEPWPQVQRAATELAGAGVSYLVCGWPEAGESRIEEFVSQVLPTLP